MNRTNYPSQAPERDPASEQNEQPQGKPETPPPPNDQQGEGALDQDVDDPKHR